MSSHAAKEIVVSFVIGLATTLGVAMFTQTPLREDSSLFRETVINEPVDVTGVMETEPTPPNKDYVPRMVASVRKTIVVAVIDTGCDIHHPDLAEQIWSNPGETGLDTNGLDKAFNGVDDDDNGFVDDAHGWDFVSNSPAIMDEHGHGTHVSGLIAKEGGGSDVRLMILKYYDAHNSGFDNLRFSTDAIRYAVRMGADIINFSGGGMMRSEREEEAVREAMKAGVLVVAAAGNEGLNTDFMPFYPADYDFPNVLSVAALDRSGHLLAGSNFGLATVDVAAPGQHLRSTLPGARYGVMSGTSQAAAYAAGVAARVMSENPTLLEPHAVIAHLLDNSRRVPWLAGRTRLGSQVSHTTDSSGRSVADLDPREAR